MPGTGSGTTTLIPSSVTTAGPGWSSQYSYTYDSMGNIATVSNGGNTTRYLYDSLKQLTREDNQAVGKSWVYIYDTGGNITSAKEYNYTTGTLGTVQSTISYSYTDSNWKDKLTSYAGSSITYDSIGNPLSYRGMTFTWDAGRQLASATSGGTTATYKYNSSGIRTSKTVGGTTTKYMLAGTQVVKAATGSDYVLYCYDESGSPVMFRTKSGSSYANYYYVKDLQGDIVAITNASGTKVVEYTYDAWGKVLTTTGSLASTIGATNPYRYRGYWFDTETGLYYLQSRYYDPQTGRFINADMLVSTGQGVLGSNMFAYCMNDPANLTDQLGLFPGIDLVLFDFYAMHIMTQIQCAMDYGFVMEISVECGDGRGRLDLYDPVHNVFYEVKSIGCVDGYDTDNQIDRYDISYIRDTKRNKDKLGKESIGKNPNKGMDSSIKGSFQYSIYDIEYKYYKPGLIVYDKKTNWESVKVLALCTVIASVGILSGGIEFGIVAGAAAVGAIY
jgi:RHS repeat-associated protein